jgi:hypothetical protein
LKEKFQQRITADYEQYIAGVMPKDKAEIVGRAKEIGTMRWIYEALKNNPYIEDAHIEYLMKFKHPLLVVHEEWMSIEHDFSDALYAIIYEIHDKQIDDYPLADDSNEIKMRGRVQMC